MLINRLQNGYLWTSNYKVNLKNHYLKQHEVYLSRNIHIKQTILYKFQSQNYKNISVINENVSNSGDIE